MLFILCVGMLVLELNVYIAYSFMDFSLLCFRRSTDVLWGSKKVGVNKNKETPYFLAVFARRGGGREREERKTDALQVVV